jgi:hypothetical protein
MNRLLIILLAVSIGGCATAIEEPHYDIKRKYKDFELRRYRPYIVAETVVKGDFSEAGNKAFRILFDYISGKNRIKEEIQMTSPVNQAPAVTAGEKIAMTAPVTQSPQGKRENFYRISFVMPSQYTMETIPQPVDSRIRLRLIDGKLMAARIYSGSWSEERYRKNEATLLSAVKAVGFSTIAPPVFARYNSPFTLWFLRRNEVLIEVAAD